MKFDQLAKAIAVGGSGRGDDRLESFFEFVAFSNTINPGINTELSGSYFANAKSNEMLLYLNCRYMKVFI